jgi:hypothetical protein
MADSEDRPIIVSGADQMITVALPPSTKTDGGSHTVNALPANGPFKTIVFTNAGKVEFSAPATGDWRITIE